MEPETVSIGRKHALWKEGMSLSFLSATPLLSLLVLVGDTPTVYSLAGHPMASRTTYPFSILTGMHLPAS